MIGPRRHCADKAAELEAGHRFGWFARNFLKAPDKRPLGVNERWQKCIISTTPWKLCDSTLSELIVLWNPSRSITPGLVWAQPFKV